VERGHAQVLAPSMPERKSTKCTSPLSRTKLNYRYESVSQLKPMSINVEHLVSLSVCGDLSCISFIISCTPSHLPQDQTRP